MPKKLEEVYYCDFCESKREKEDIILECMSPRYDPAASEMDLKSAGGVHHKLQSVIRLTDQVGAKRNTLETGGAVMCKDCLAKTVGFGSWNDLRHGASLVKIEQDNKYKRGGPGDR